MRYGQESTNICCKLCQDGTGCQILSDTRAEGGWKPSPVTPVSEWSYVIVGILWCGMQTLSNEVQVGLVSKDSPAHSLWSKRYVLLLLTLSTNPAQIT